MDDKVALEERATLLLQLEEDCFIASFHQLVEKDRHIKNKQF